MDLKNTILAYRAMHGLSQVDFAYICGITQQTLVSIEKGTQKPSRLTLAKMLLVLNNKKEVEVENYLAMKKRKKMSEIEKRELDVKMRKEEKKRELEKQQQEEKPDLMLEDFGK